MKLDDVLSEALFEGKFKVVTVKGGSLIVPQDASVNNIIALRDNLTIVKRKLSAKNGSLQRLMKLFNNNKMPTIDFGVLEDELDNMLLAVAVTKEPMPYQVAYEMLDEIHEVGPEVWIKKHHKGD